MVSIDADVDTDAIADSFSDDGGGEGGGGDGGTDAGGVDAGEGGVDLDTGFGGGGDSAGDVGGDVDVGGGPDPGDVQVDIDPAPDPDPIPQPPGAGPETIQDPEPTPRPPDDTTPQPQPPGAGPETIEDPAPTPSDVEAVPTPTDGDGGDDTRISTPNQPAEDPEPTQGIETVSGAGGDVGLAFAGRRREQQILEQNPGLDAEDVRIGPSGQPQLTATGRDFFRGRFESSIEDRSRVFGGQLGLPTPTQLESPNGRGGGADISAPTEIRGAPQTTGGRARENLEQQLEEQFGTDLEEGRDFTVSETTNEAGETILQAELTEEGQIAVATAAEAESTAVRAFENLTGADLSRDAAIHRTGRGLLPSGAEFEQQISAFDAPPATALPQTAVPNLGNQFFQQIGRATGRTLNVAQLTESVLQAGEATGEFATDATVATVGAPVALALNDPGLQEDVQIASERTGRKGAAAAATAAALPGAAIEFATKNPQKAAGEVFFLGGTAGVAEVASPLRFARFRVPTTTGKTVARGLRLERPPIVRGAVGASRGRTLVGQRGLALSRGSPTVDLADVDFEELGGQGATFERIGPFESDVMEASVRRFGEPEDIARIEAQRDVADLATSAKGPGLQLTSTEEIVREVPSVPEGRAGAVAEALADVDATIFGSAAVRAQFPAEARAPGDIDILVDDPVGAEARLAEALGDANAEVEDIFDIKATGEKAGPGEPVKLGEPAQSRLTTEEGVEVTRAGEELLKKTGAAGFLRGRGSPAPEFVGETGGFDIGPEPIRQGLPPRFKDVGDVSALSRLLAREEATAASPIRRFRGRRAERAIETFETEFEPELGAVPPSRRPGGVVALPEPGGRGFLRPIAGATDRGQFTMVDLLPDGGDAVRAERLADADVDGIDDIGRVARRQDDDLLEPTRASSVTRRSDFDTVGLGASPSPLFDGAAGGVGAVPSSGGRPVDMDDLGAVSSPSPGRDIESVLRSPLSSPGGGGLPSGFGSPTSTPTTPTTIPVTSTPTGGGDSPVGGGFGSPGTPPSPPSRPIPETTTTIRDPDTDDEQLDGFGLRFGADFSKQFEAATFDPSTLLSGTLEDLSEPGDATMTPIDTDPTPELLDVRGDVPTGVVEELETNPALATEPPF